ncbi:MAG: hydantoinase B/oxoprolinase family protein [SAR324 cluster bacterium]|nr:hydantoinase B/oxoprolinase family protein [SAR324 cluster bacterium]
MSKEKNSRKWQFWIDRGGTFTDIVACTPEGEIKTMKLLSHNPRQYEDASLAGIRKYLDCKKNQKIPTQLIDSVKMGTTVATNALLERKGEPTLLLITQGLSDVLQIGYQNRPKLFDLNINLPESIYSQVIEAKERIDYVGKILSPLNEKELEKKLTKAYQNGFNSIAIVFMHGYKYPAHEKIAGKIARRIGFKQISLSHEVSALVKIVGRGDTSVVDAYLSPILQRYVSRLSGELSKTNLLFMQSNSSLTEATSFRGKDAVLSGPAGGIVGMVQTAKLAGLNNLIGFDMGGTSTDVSHYNGEYERVFEKIVAGVRMRAPMMNIDTVAAGGGSILKYDGMRFSVGPESAGAFPGPACYRNQGPLTVTDCNLALGRISANFFPHVFGEKRNMPLDINVVQEKFSLLAKKTNKSVEEIAEGFLKIAVDNMSNAIRRISVRRGYDISKYTLCCFGGAGGQHACSVAERLGMKQVFIHPLAGVLSAYGMGFANVGAMREKTTEIPLNKRSLQAVSTTFKDLEDECLKELAEQGVKGDMVRIKRKVHVRYMGTNSELILNSGEINEIQAEFEKEHQSRFGFIIPKRKLILGTISIEAFGGGKVFAEPALNKNGFAKKPISLNSKKVYFYGKFYQTNFYDRAKLLCGQKVIGPAIIIEPNSTLVVEPGWIAEITEKNHILLLHHKKIIHHDKIDSTKADPIRLEIFNNLYMSIAEQMGEVLANTSYSVNIKERQDFSCALFDHQANLIANAPHIPVHLGSMGESVRAVIKKWGSKINPGDSFALNDPYEGGTHLPDITIISPVFIDRHILFYVASRGHHADIGGITPGSMPPNSTHLEQEGVLIKNVQIVGDWKFDEIGMRKILASGKYPARNIDENIEDLKAQIAANEKGATELYKMIKQYGKQQVIAYISHVQENAAESVRMIIGSLSSNEFSLKTDHGSVIKVKIKINKKERTAVVDFTGTSSAKKNNLNAPLAVCRSAVLYVFRTLIKENIPMNEGCLTPITLIVPQGCMLNPTYPAAVVAGNVETSQAIVDTLYGALKTVAESQGTMNNLTFGNDNYQYYETICGGTGAGNGFSGTDAVHSHMTNSLITDPEILENRYPVILRKFAIRKNSGGAGKYCGGNGTIRQIEFCQEVTVSVLSSHRIYAPYGLKGGKTGALGENLVIKKNKKSQTLASSQVVSLQKGDTILIKTPGGGGYGEAA